ncbi:TadE/TadG family protein [Allosphingosinicella vermicomposti]|uniref:TadE/TadG family protein n=1 Tax=Allosphingosinicella vermicomposti TaxID=614671 RepID=UPI000D0EE9E4|nr:TadE/TadG family protein [Allosphingosinicella vermicomposti]
MNKRAICNARDNKRTTFLSRLMRDTRGNTLAIVGAAFIPLTAMVGSGVDLSRAYMAKNRLQSACDSASLAARRVMQNDTLTDDVVKEAKKFINFNFPQETYGTLAFTPVVTKPAQGTVHIDVETRIPTSIMKIFGFSTLPLEVSCEASQNFVNTDIILVLDTTGSMAGSRIAALRDAVMALYTELEPIQTQLEANGMRLRYGIVPYSSNVSVGHIVKEMEPAGQKYIADNWYYHSRRPIYRTSTVTRQGNTTRGICHGQQRLRDPETGYPATLTETVWARSGGAQRDCWLIASTFANSQDERVKTDNDGNKQWRYGIVNQDVRAYVSTAGGIPTPHMDSNQPSEWQHSTWKGCIEERDTVTTIASSTPVRPVPAGALDLNIDLVPQDEASTWRPYWPEIIYNMESNTDGYPYGYNGGESVACPAKAKRLQKWSKSDMQNYVNALVAHGNTYHDIGMIWGARLISSGGIFASDNPDNYNSMPVSRHIIYMTDGELVTNDSFYTFHGIENRDHRVRGNSGDSLTVRHDKRFRMACDAAKAKNVSLWVVAFGTGLTDSLKFCASSESQAFRSNNRDELIAKFTEIGKNIGSLRLSL